ncbi:hypothetical protein KP509_35G033800 [Ceratopteris richardii]|uniref:Exocyst subunit Exo70 family protein n=1 Tax=Ceratopteris richardii TaxID=49495 RepID=A0A8T2QFL0_CERRI|nr:hypothetical protein KP509_35G033800 [Ceratopteris richardii]
MASHEDNNKRTLVIAQNMLDSPSSYDSYVEDGLHCVDEPGFSAVEKDYHARILNKAGKTVLKWEKSCLESSDRTQIWSDEAEAEDSYLRAVDELQDLMESLSVSNRERMILERAQTLIQTAVSRLEEEFKHLLLLHSSSLDPEWILELLAEQSANNETEDTSGVFFNDQEDRRSICVSNGTDNGNMEDDNGGLGPSIQDANFTLELLPSDVIYKLNAIAQRMIACGSGRACTQIFASIRKALLEQSLLRLGVEKLSTEDVHKMPWELLEVRIKKWVHTVKIAVRVLYASERDLCEHVFEHLSPWRECAFADLARSSMIQILGLAESIAISRRSPEKLFKILDMYETLWDLLPDINLIFSDDLCCSVRAEAHGILVRLGEAARGIFAEFENAIQRDASKVPVAGGGVHPLTRYVMNYIWLLFSYSGVLRKLLGDKKMDVLHSNALPGVNEEKNPSGTDKLSPLGVQIIWLTVLLECNLDGKSKMYRDVAQSYLFLMNNAHYIVQKVKQSELSSLVGEDWVLKHSSMVRQYATNYVRAAWVRVLACLRDEGIATTGTFFSGISKAVLKERFKAFNGHFEELLRTQSAWIVPDPQLREDLRSSIAEKLIPAYRSFSSRYASWETFMQIRQVHTRGSAELFARLVRRHGQRHGCKEEVFLCWLTSRAEYRKLGHVHIAASEVYSFGANVYSTLNLTLLA